MMLGLHRIRGFFLGTYRTIVALLIVSIVFGPLSEWFPVVRPATTEAAQVNIDTSAQSSGTSHTRAGSQTVFISDRIGYKFYRDSGGDCVYSKTTDGGDVWGAAVQVDSQTDCISIAVWYDRWTPNDFGNTIHIATIDNSSNNDNIFYNALDTTNDSRLTGAAAINTDPGNVQTYTLVLGDNNVSITKATNGTLYVSVDDASDSAVLRCSTTCGTGTNWSEAGTRPQDLATDWSMLLPLVSGNVMIINRDISADVIRSKIWNNAAGSWSASWTTIDGAAPDNITYDVGMSATIASSTIAATTTIFLAYIAQNTTLGTDDDVRTAVYANGVWTARTDVLTNDSKGLTSVAISRDENTGNIYVGYSGRTTPGTGGTGNVYWKVSTTTMTSWSTETGPVNTSANDIYGVDLNIRSGDRIYMTWFGVTGATIFGDTIADLVPGVTVSTSSSHVVNATASTSDVYLGGIFVMAESKETRSISSITIDERGTVDASANLKNIELYYKSDSSFPFDCQGVNYDGSAIQYGSTVSGGFTSANGTATFTGSVNISTSSALCFYVVADILDGAANGETIKIGMPNASTSVVVSGGGEVRPTTELAMSGSVTILNDIITQTHFHWRNDNNTEALATSKTGGVQDTALPELSRGTPARLRFGISNEGGTTSPARQYRLEYEVATSTCDNIVNWIDVGATNDAFNMYDSTHLTDGSDTTNVAEALGGVANENTNYLSPNGGVKDTSSQTGNIILSETQYVDLEYSIIASTSAIEGSTYCFRLSDAGTPLPVYSQYARATIAADVTVSVFGSQITGADVPTNNVYIGGAFVITENSSSRDVTSITLWEDDTVDASTGLENIRIRYDLDTVAPHDCADETYDGTEPLFGSPVSAFSGANGTSTFTDSVTITTTATMCVYVILDVTEAALNGERFNIFMTSPTADVIVSSGSVAPSVTRDITGSTTLRAAILTQTHYHWRNDNGSETTATSRTLGLQDTPLDTLSDGTPIRLRLQVSNEGGTSSPATVYGLEYGQKITSCAAVDAWVDVSGVNAVWEMFDSASLTNGANTTDIDNAIGGVDNENASFLASNGGIRDTSATTGSITLSETQYTEFEFAIEQIEEAGFSTPYCFRLTRNDLPLPAYSQYAELTTAPERDFKIQRGTSTLSGTSLTLTAGVDYAAPAASTSAFIRITNTHHTGAGSTAGGTQNAADVTAYIQDPWNIRNSVTFVRTGSTNNTRISWEIVEFTGKTGSDNEMIVRQQQAVTYGTTDLVATGTSVSGVVDSRDIVVFITGQGNPDTGTGDYNTGLATASWSSSTQQAVFTRGEHGDDAVNVSYAVIEFVGPNWKIQRAEHTYSAAGSPQTEDIELVNSLSRAFLHVQKRVGAGLQGVDEFGHEVWLSSLGQVSFQLESGAGTPADHTSVAWVVENTQTSTGAMVVTQSDGNTSNGTAPFEVFFPMGTTVSDLENASIFTNNRSSITQTFFPRPMLGVTLTSSTTAYQLWRSNTNSTATFRTEIVEWPIASIVVRQNDYQFYVDNNDLTPTDAWPPGGTALGENTVLTVNDEPLGGEERIRIRMSLAVSNSNLPAQSQDFALQYGVRSTVCSALGTSDWRMVGEFASTTAHWRGYNATGTTDGTTLTSLLLSASDVAGTFEEQNDSALNPNRVRENEDVEYDWLIEQNNAQASTTYCFRMVKASGQTLDGYLDYPQIHTASFDPESLSWRWYDDESSMTPSVPLDGENIAPIDLENQNVVKLRVAVADAERVAGPNARFKIQFSEYSTFATATDVLASTSCSGASLWCYADAAGVDNAKIQNALLTDSDSCVAGVGDGCGTHNESSLPLTGFTHPAGAVAEYEFSIRSDGPRVNRTYYFRLVEVGDESPVPVASGYTYPSVSTKGAEMVLTGNSLATSTVIDGVTTDVATTPSLVSFGTLAFNDDRVAAQRFSISTNATEGYQMLMYSTMLFTSDQGEVIPFINASNTSPTAWSLACPVEATGCYGYHVGDDTLAGGSTRFAPNDTYAAFETTPREVAYSSIPVVNDTVDVVYRVEVRDMQPTGQYRTDIVFVVIPVF